MPPSLTPPMVSVGVSMSTLMPLTVLLAVLPALSVTVRVTDWLAPLPLSMTGLGQAATPDPTAPLAPAGSEQANVTVTACVYQPLLPSGLPGVTAAEIIGAVLSRWKWNESLPWLPALSAAAPVMT